MCVLFGYSCLSRTQIPHSHSGEFDCSLVLLNVSHTSRRFSLFLLLICSARVCVCALFFISGPFLLMSAWMVVSFFCCCQCKIQTVVNFIDERKCALQYAPESGHILKAQPALDVVHAFYVMCDGSNTESGQHTIQTKPPAKKRKASILQKIQHVILSVFLCIV